MKKTTTFILSLLFISGNLFSQKTAPPEDACEKDITTGLIAQYDFSGNANEKVYGQNNGVVTSVTLTTDRFGNENSAYQFNSESRIDCGTADVFDLNECTFSAWIYMDEFTEDWQTILSKYDVNWEGSYTFSLLGSKLNIWFTIEGEEGGDFMELNSNTTLNTNTWYHVTATHSYSGGTKLYINGVLDAYDDRQFNVFQAPTDHFRIGSQGDFYPVPMLYGKIDDIRVYNKELSDCSIDSLYQLPNPTLTSLTSKAPIAKFSVYPNPSSGKFVISLDNNFSTQSTTLSLFNAVGQKISEYPINSLETEIEANTLENGIYYLTISSTSGLSSTKLLVDNK